MTTKTEIIAALKAENPTLRAGSDEDGYVDLTAADYEATIEDWANARIAKAQKLVEAEALVQAKLEAIDKLIALGIDPKALGLGTN
jgi:hypothetical protein